MNRPTSQYEYMSLDEFEELLPDKPADEKWELIGGRVVRMMVGAAWPHNRIVANIMTAFMSGLRAKGSNCRPFAETFWLKQRFLKLACFPDVMVRHDRCRRTRPRSTIRSCSSKSCRKARRNETATRNGRFTSGFRRSSTMSSSNARHCRRCVRSGRGRVFSARA